MLLHGSIYMSSKQEWNIVGKLYFKKFLWESKALNVIIVPPFSYSCICVCVCVCVYVCKLNLLDSVLAFYMQGLGWKTSYTPYCPLLTYDLISTDKRTTLYGMPFLKGTAGSIVGPW